MLYCLETIRTTLLDPAKRAGYDAGIGLGAVTNLTDPDLIVRISPTPPSASPSSANSNKQVAPSQGLWVCPKCGTDNPEHTQYCFKCAAQLVRECPKCRKISSLISTGICGNCGTQYEYFVQLSQLQRQKTMLMTNRASLDQDINILSEKFYRANKRDYRQLLPLILVGIGTSIVSCFLGGISLAFVSYPSITSLIWAGLFIIAIGGCGIILAGVGLWNFRTYEMKRQSFQNNVRLDIEFKQQQIVQIDAQCVALDKAIKELG